MRKLIIQQWVTLDMFAATEDGGLKFMHAQDSDQPEDPSIEQFQFDFLDTVDTFLLGHNTYDLFFEYWPEMTTDREIISEN